MARRRSPAPFLKAARGTGWRQRTTLEGSADLQAVLRSVDRAISGRALLVALDKGSAITADVMGQLAPRSEDGSRGNPPGFLSQNIGREVTRVSGKRAQVAVAPKKEAFYGIFQEIGTSDMPAQPFMRPALDSTRDAVVAAVGEELRRIVEALASGD